MSENHHHELGGHAEACRQGCGPVYVNEGGIVRVVKPTQESNPDNLRHKVGAFLAGMSAVTFDRLVDYFGDDVRPSDIYNPDGF